MVDSPGLKGEVVERIQWTPLAPFGALVDLKLVPGLPAAIRDELAALFRERSLLVFRNQHLSLAEQVEVSSWFGPVPADGVGVLSLDKATGYLGTSELTYHSDLESLPDPVLALTFHALEVIDGQSSTRFANGIAAAENLPPKLRERLQGLQAMHVWPVALSDRQLGREVAEDWPGTAHPVLMPHPATGRLVLYVTEQQTNRILGLSKTESEELLRTLLARLYDSGNVYEHFWCNGDFVMCDNRALQHARSDLKAVSVRQIQRVQLGSPSSEIIRLETKRLGDRALGLKREVANCTTS